MTAEFVKLILLVIHEDLPYGLTLMKLNPIYTTVTISPSSVLILFSHPSLVLRNYE
jgi:hypothetical protein